MRKGVLLIGSYPPPFGGISSHIQYLVPYLVSHGYDVHVISSGTGKAVEKINGFTIYRPSRSKRILKIASHFLESLRRIPKLTALGLSARKECSNVIGEANIIQDIISKNKNIVVISAYHLFPEGLIGAILNEVFSVPLVVTNFGEIYARPNFFTERLSVVNYICKRSSKILSSSQHCARSYRLLGIEPSVEVIPYGIDIKHFSSGKQGAIIRQKLGISSQDRIVLFVGRMIRDMGLHTLLGAIPQVLQVRGSTKFLIAGAKGELFEPALELKAQYEDSVFVIPDVSFEELPCFYTSSTVVTAPTPDERACMGMAIKEAMATGKPVIAAKTGGIPEAVVEGKTGILVAPEDPHSLAEAILGLVDNEDGVIRMGRAGRKRAEALFDKDVTNQKIHSVFQEVTGV